ncbi:Hypothetical predicted protein [Cloeon dipterum]|uniref:Cupin-like domain-containing protein n=1 Tax=Cloeon dipterum TaxID=197152 RepID=A0A8S1CDW9_9INSE|nr:Hypothetical predicted protein [Cloeon dipterum]
MEERKKVIAEAEAELDQILQHTSDLSEADLALACAPLLAAHRQYVLRRAVLLLVAVAVATLIATNSATAKLHLHAVARVALVKLLPWWDWRPLHRQRCLLPNPHFSPPPASSKDECLSCEAIDRVDRVADTSYQQLLDRFLQRDAPVIVTDAMDSWPAMRSDKLWFDNFTQVYTEEKKLKGKKPRPCALSSNIRADSTILLKRLNNPRLDHWFAHWLNCDASAMKAMRQFYQRPYFLASSVAPAHFNWIVLSSNYWAKSYKKLRLEAGLIMVHQLRGSTHFRLVPVPLCEEMCTEITETVREGEILVFLSFLWDLHYSSGRGAENMAIITETIWDTFTVY